MIKATEILSDYICALEYEDIPKAVVEQTRLYLLDWTAACMAGYRINRKYNQAVEDIYFAMGGAEEASVLFSGCRLPAMNTAFVNATYAHGADLDDGNKQAMGHVAAPVISAVLAYGEALQSSEQELVTAINVGYEIFCRIGAAVQPGLIHRGFHSTGTVGGIAAAAACVKLLQMKYRGEYGAKDFFNAMALASTQASGLMLITASGQSCKPVNPAKAAQTGVFTAQMIRLGAGHFTQALEGEKGWFLAMSSEIDERVITNGLGQTFSIMQCYLKPYPACRHTHCGLQAVAELRAQIDAPIEKINIHIYSNAIKVAGQIRHPQTSEETKFSIHYATACMAAQGSFGLHDIESLNQDENVLQMIDRIALIPDETMENREQGIRGARVEIILKNGKRLEKTILVPKGDLENPFTEDDMRKKLFACGNTLCSEMRLCEIEQNVKRFGACRTYDFKRIFGEILA